LARNFARAEAGWLGEPIYATGSSVPRDAQLRDHKQRVERRRLNDIDLVVESFASITESVARSFLQHHVHPDAVEGKFSSARRDGEDRGALKYG
jgi:hypothetical protein